jgi:cation:H+ antiporter
MAAMRRETSVVFGNILGSNIQNILSILGITATVQTIIIPDRIAQLDIWIMLGATIMMLVFAATRWRLNRTEGGIMLTAYFLYLGYLAYAEDIGRIAL